MPQKLRPTAPDASHIGMILYDRFDGMKRGVVTGILDTDGFADAPAYAFDRKGKKSFLRVSRAELRRAA